MATMKRMHDTTIDDLANMVNRGFTDLQKQIGSLTHQVESLTHQVESLTHQVETITHIQKAMLEELNATHTDVRYLRTTVDMLTRSDTMQEVAIDDLKTRVRRLERKSGLAT